MKKSIAARNYWFNYTARMRHDREMKKNHFKSEHPFTHFLLTMWLYFKATGKNLFKKVMA